MFLYRSGILTTLLFSLCLTALGQGSNPAAQNAKTTAENEALKKAFEAGNAAFAAKNYDAAIANFDTALKIYEQPPILANKALALHARAVDKYNSLAKMPAGPARVSALEKAKADWLSAAEASGKAVAIARPADGLGHASLLSYLKTHAMVMRFVATKVDPGRVREASLVFNEYFDLEKDPTALDKARLEQAQFFLDVGEYNGAYLWFGTIVEKFPNDIDANFGFAAAAFGLMDPKYFQNSANAAKKFLDLARPADPRRKDAQDIIAYVKAEAGIVPK